MSYQVLARKWRPRTFTELVGQAHVVRPLVNALDNNRLHHAFLFSGTRGVGKTTIARILAKSLNCETGVTSRPCGVCSSCVEVDEGRFIDLIEVDAASRTKVDDTRELLDNVQYAPTRGRYKVYLIDEVHMLSGHSFNALLKTLEEPPPHVKFLLATTDPQKLPVTVLSRCLQFALKRLVPTEIAAQLQKILDAEKIPCDSTSVDILARGADGSMRDGLSLLDQAIAYGAGRITEADVRAMLGTIDQDAIEHVLTALATNDTRALLGVIADVVDQGGDPEALLDELIRALYRVALAQVDVALVEADAERIGAHARALLPEDVQLFYQIAIIGRRDCPLAPDPRTGVEMTLLRMLAFRPVDVARAPGAIPDRGLPSTPTGSREPAPAPVLTSTPNIDSGHEHTTPPRAASPAAAVSGTSWVEVVAGLKLSGVVRELANHTTLESESGDVVSLVLNESCARLLNKEREATLKVALEEHYGRAIRLMLRVGRPPVETPAQAHARTQDERQQAAVQAIDEDPNVRALRERFNARVNPASIRPAAEDVR